MNLAQAIRSAKADEFNRQNPLVRENQTKKNRSTGLMGEMVGEDMDKDSIKHIAVAVLVIAVIALAYYFLVVLGGKPVFDPGPVVNGETFTMMLINSTDMLIFSDVRGIKDDLLQRNVLQCSVDFASSSYLGSKNVTYLSIGDGENGCVDSKGAHPVAFCFEKARSSPLTIYVTSGNVTTYHQHGMVVGIGKDYSLGSCGVRSE